MIELGGDVYALRCDFAKLSSRRQYQEPENLALHCRILMLWPCDMLRARRSSMVSCPRLSYYLSPGTSLTIAVCLRNCTLRGKQSSSIGRHRDGNSEANHRCGRVILFHERRVDRDGRRSCTKPEIVEVQNVDILRSRNFMARRGVDFWR